MNASRRTRIIAQGIALWAEVQDCSIADLANMKKSGNPYTCVDAFDQWSNEYPDYVSFVKREQFKLLDRVNAAF